MNKLAVLTLAGSLAVGAVVAQPPTLSHPLVPAREALDRLNLRFAWRILIPVDGRRDGIATVQNLGDLLIVQTRSGSVSAIDPSTGATRWRTVVGEPFHIIHDVGANDQLILVASSTRVYGLDRAGGQLLWEVTVPSTPTSPPSADDAAFYMHLSNGRVAAYAFPGEAAPTPPGATPPAGTPGGPAQVSPGQSAGAPGAAGRPGTAKVEAPRPTTASQGPGGTGRTVRFSGSVDTRTGTLAAQATVSPGYGGRLASGGGNINATRSATGGGNINATRSATGGGDINRTARGAIEVLNAPRLLWFFQTNLRVRQRPLLSENTMLVISSDRTALFLNALHGDLPSEYQADAPFTAPAAQYGETAYLGSQDGGVYAVHLPTRSVQWRYTANSIVTAVPVATDEDLYVSTDLGGLTRINRATGDMIWQVPEARHFLAANPKFVYAADRQNRLMVLERARGAVLTLLDTRDFFVPVENNKTDRVYLGAHDGTLLCLHDKAYPQPLRTQNLAAPPAAPAGATPPAPAGVTPPVPAAPPAGETKPAAKPAAGGK
jgi:outer membrane protein assembly factor BamB